MSAAWEEHFAELAELSEAERASRLEELKRENPDLARQLRERLAADSAAERVF
ncbi:MAG TPA: hypothetical protein VKM72_11635 [Thermoanaerobaculia bacterium]|nr:hypothetical protein [Thermoanaerobaculia bacterium]